MYVSIKWMIKFSSNHRCDQPEFESDWTSKRQRVRHTFKEKLIYSLKRQCEQNLELYKDFQNIIDGIKSNFLNNADCEKLDEQLRESIGNYVINQEGIIEEERFNGKKVQEEPKSQTVDNVIKDEISRNNQKKQPNEVCRRDSCSQESYTSAKQNASPTSPKGSPVPHQIQNQKYLSFFSIGDKIS